MSLDRTVCYGRKICVRFPEKNEEIVAKGLSKLFSNLIETAYLSEYRLDSANKLTMKTGTRQKNKDIAIL